MILNDRPMAIFSIEDDMNPHRMLHKTPLNIQFLCDLYARCLSKAKDVTQGLTTMGDMSAEEKLDVLDEMSTHELLAWFKEMIRQHERQEPCDETITHVIDAFYNTTEIATDERMMKEELMEEMSHWLNSQFARMPMRALESYDAIFARLKEYDAQDIDEDLSEGADENENEEDE